MCITFACSKVVSRSLRKYLSSLPCLGTVSHCNGLGYIASREQRYWKVFQINWELRYEKI